jgi:hypothetical protein
VVDGELVHASGHRALVTRGFFETEVVDLVDGTATRLGDRGVVLAVDPLVVEVDGHLERLDPTTFEREVISTLPTNATGGRFPPRDEPPSDGTAFGPDGLVDHHLFVFGDGDWVLVRRDGSWAGRDRYGRLDVTSASPAPSGVVPKTWQHLAATTALRWRPPAEHLPPPCAWPPTP